jgi:hypothetical protein
MIRHYDVAADCNSTLLAQLCKFDQAQVHSTVSEQFPLPMCVERYEVQRRIIFLKDQMQSRRSIGHSSDRAL